MTRARPPERTARRIFYACFEDLTREAAWTVHIREVVDTWEKTGVAVTLFAPRIWPFSISPACEVIYIPTINVWIVREYLYLMLLPFYILIFGLKKRPHAVYCREMSLMAPIVGAARLLGAPVVMEINGFLLRDQGAIGAGLLKCAMLRLMQRINLAVVDALVFVSEDFVRLFRNEYGLGKGKVHFVPNGVDTALFSPGDRTQAVRSAGLPAGRRYVTFVGSFHPHSLTPVIVRAAGLVLGSHPDVDFLMIGVGHDLDLCRNTAVRLGVADRFNFTGMVNHRDIPAYLRASEVLINLVGGAGDNPSMKLLEYMAVGGAVVVNVGLAFGIPLTHRRDCWLIGEPTPEGLAEALEALLGDGVLREEIGANARAFVCAHFSWETTCSRILSIIDGVRRHG